MSPSKVIVVSNSDHTVRCPECNSLETEWHPATREGRCHARGCGARWRVVPPERGKKR